MRVYIEQQEDINYYHKLRAWLRECDITEWQWDDSKDCIVFKHDSDALVFKLRFGL
jgi:hypothetical protein